MINVQNSGTEPVLNIYDKEKENAGFRQHTALQCTG